MREGGRLGFHSVDVHTVAWCIYGGSAADRERVSRGGVLVWDFTQVQREVAPLLFTPPDGYCEVVTRGEGDEKVSVVRQPATFPDRVLGCYAYKPDRPIFIAASDTFGMLLFLCGSRPLDEDTFVRVDLLGTTARGT